MSDKNEDPFADDSIDETDNPNGPDAKSLKRKRSKKISKKIAGKFFEEQADESDVDGEPNSEDDEESSDEDGDDYQEDGFVVMAGDIENQDDGQEKKSKKKRKAKKRRELKVDEEDLELVRENRQEQSKPEKQWTMEDSADEEGSDAIDPEGDYGEEDNFIDDGQEVKRYEMKQKRQEKDDNRERLMQLAAIFGPDFIYGENENEDYDDYDEEIAAPMKPRRTATATTFEHIEMVEHFLLKEDADIVETDIPERFQAYLTSADKRFYRWRVLDTDSKNVISEDERNAEARWIASKIVDNCGLKSNLADIPHTELVDSIINILKLLQEEHLEVPFIWLYRRDKIHRAFIREHVWQTLQLDMKWCRLQYDIGITFHYLERLGETLKEMFVPEVASKILDVKYYEDLLEQTTDEDLIRDIRRFAALIDSGMGKLSRSGQGLRSTAAADDDLNEPEENDEVLESSAKTLNRSAYARYKKLEGVRHYISFFTAPVHEIGSALFYELTVNHPATRNIDPVQSATELIDGMKIRSVSQLNKAVEQVVATELSMEPTIRMKTREVFRSGGSISTEVTDKGKQTITTFSSFFGVHCIEDKPIKEFFTRKGLMLFMKMLEAEQLGYIKIIIKGPELDGKPHPGAFAMHLGKFLLSTQLDDDEHFESRQAWDGLRLQIIRTTIEKFLVPSFIKEIRAELTRLGKDAIIDEAAAAFELKLKTGPFIPCFENESETLTSLLTEAPQRPHAESVVGFFFSQDKRMSLHMVCVDKDGCVKAHHEIPSQAMIQKKDKVEAFLYENRPELIVINSAAGVNARNLQTLIEKEIIDSINQALKLQYEYNKRQDEYDYSRNDEKPIPTFFPKILIGDDSLASNFKVSKRAKKLLTLTQQDAAAAVSLARFALEPLAEYANLWMTAEPSTGLFGYEAFYLNFHPLQQLVEGYKTKFIRALEFKLVDAISDVGVDIRKVCKHDHLAPMLAFIPGLGLRKANSLRRTIIEKESRLQAELGENDEGVILLESRRVIQASNMLGPITYNNAAGFLRITYSDVISNWNPLDDTRIHPECYDENDFVAKICCSALDLDNNPSLAHANIAKLMKKVRQTFEKTLQEKPNTVQVWANGKPDITDTVAQEGFTITQVDMAVNDCLAEQDMNDSNESLLTEGHGNRILQMEHIKEELRFPWLDLRWPYRGIAPDKFFNMVSGETDETLYIGRKLGFTVLRHSEPKGGGDIKSVMVKTENNLKGYISKFGIFDERPPRDFDITKHFPIDYEGMAVVVAIHKDNFRLQLSVKPSYMKENETWWLKNWHRDPNAKRYWVDKYFNGQFDQMYDDADLYAILYDSYFNLKKALTMVDDVENKQRLANIHAAYSRMLMDNNSAGESYDGPKVPNKGVTYARMVVHPFFANIDAKGAEERLRREGNGAGAVLFRPSSSGHDQLAITWQFQEGVFRHIHVKEKVKPSAAGPTKISDELFILEDDMETYRFYDIDEIQATYIEKLNELVQLMISYPKFMRGSPQGVENELNAQANAKSGIIPYGIRFEPGKPLFILTWLQLKPDGSRVVKTIPIHVHFKGFRVMTKCFATPPEIIHWFKQSITQSHQKAQEQRAMIAERNKGGDYFGQRTSSSYTSQPHRPSRFDQEAPVAAPSRPYNTNSSYGNYGNGDSYGSSSYVPNTGAYNSIPAPPVPPPRRR